MKTKTMNIARRIAEKKADRARVAYDLGAIDTAIRLMAQAALWLAVANDSERVDMSPAGIMRDSMATL